MRDIETELQATRLWLEMLVTQAAAKPILITPDWFDELVLYLKGSEPLDHLKGTGLTPEHFDAASVHMVPQFEEIGRQMKALVAEVNATLV